jgi:hypothetical protein
VTEAFSSLARTAQRIALATLLAAALATAGCHEPLPPVARPDRAREALTTALDAWKGGAEEASLKARTPAIYVNEPAWRAGAKLLDYEIASEQEAGQSWRCEVTLTLQRAADARFEEHAQYTIDTDPALVIARQ